MLQPLVRFRAGSRALLATATAIAASSASALCRLVAAHREEEIGTDRHAVCAGVGWAAQPLRGEGRGRDGMWTGVAWR